MLLTAQLFQFRYIQVICSLILREYPAGWISNCTLTLLGIPRGGRTYSMRHSSAYPAEVEFIPRETLRSTSQGDEGHITGYLSKYPESHPVEGNWDHIPHTVYFFGDHILESTFLFNLLFLRFFTGFFGLCQYFYMMQGTIPISAPLFGREKNYIMGSYHILITTKTAKLSLSLKLKISENYAKL